LLYHSGEGIPKNDAEAVRWLRKAADQGNDTAQNNLGAAYLEGQGIAKDETEAVKWFRKAAEQNNEVAQRNLGVAYANGTGVSKDAIQADMWFALATKNGDSVAATDINLLKKQMSPAQIVEAKRRADAWKPTPEAMPDGSATKK